MSVRTRFLHDNALSLVALALFVLSLVGQALCGLYVARDEAREHGASPPTLGAYLRSGDFVEVTFENWESEFFQMALFVQLTKFLRQRGSSESKKLEGEASVDEDPRKHRHDPDAPWPVRHGGVALYLYERSLFLSFALLFVASFVLHGVGGAEKYNEELMRHGRPAVSMPAYLGSAQFWFESFQNWQSEFLSVAALVVFSIYLRDRGSPQSKPVAAPHAQTGEG